MILPSKHINFSQSLLGFGSYLLENLKRPKSVDELWRQYNLDYKNGNYHAKQTFDNLILALIFLYGINAISETKGLISKCN
ncbi:ABC-three component system middle component 6 [Filimonas zeae]|uniref:ABC-three component system middle component 6 n=1 Tax=Filimonas zeae TaxID=1737353 RepID=UPI0035711105